MYTQKFISREFLLYILDAIKLYANYYDIKCLFR